MIIISDNHWKIFKDVVACDKKFDPEVNTVFTYYVMKSEKQTFDFFARFWDRQSLGQGIEFEKDATAREWRGAGHVWP